MAARPPTFRRHPAKSETFTNRFANETKMSLYALKMTVETSAINFVHVDQKITHIMTILCQQRTFTKKQKCIGEE